MFKIYNNAINRFFTSIKEVNGCWEWQGSLTKSGYGRFAFKSRTYRAHRFSYIIHKGDIKDKNIICHTCDNPKCVNPDHLWQGTIKQNTHDMIEKGRLVRTRSKAKGRSSKYIGVSYRKEYGKWRARKLVNYKNHFLGNFDTEEEAYQAILKWTG